ncbi:TetR/AcrR family transcriptional regulator [Diaminobutyricibacter sp. McL0618]|uniref:TetR/AcrR family transcriptional regulator n=1 Tax=Leifsonia sp. McL0618 TaxID=3415677 RepID=UPI003CECE0F0
MDQIAAGGPDAVSLNGIARTMGMAPAGFYRYFENREALIADLVVDAYNALADAIEMAGRSPANSEQRFTAVTSTFRAWAVDQPNAYRLIFQTIRGSGRDLPAASRSTGVILTCLSALAVRPPRALGDRNGEASSLDDQLASWAERTETMGLPPRLLALGVACWTRLHGVISLELSQHLAATGIDPQLFYEAEVATLIEQAQDPGAGEF